MMRLATHEAYELHELAMSCVNSITNMAVFMEQAQDPQLKSMLQSHFPFHVRDYNMKVQYLSQMNGATGQLPVPDMNHTLQSYTQSPINNYPTMVPRTNLQMFNDREIATAYLLNLKRAGREYAWATMETANPEIRSFLEDAFRLSSHHAFEVWQWMVQKGYYPLESVPAPTLNTFGHFYQQIPQTRM
jgi:spore coat protein CotF